MKTKTPGVFKRIDGEGNVVGYVAVIRMAGRQRKRNVRTYEAARRIKRESETDRDRGELQERTTITFEESADAVVISNCRARVAPHAPWLIDLLPPLMPTTIYGLCR